jgi:hypothetical protein
MAHFGVAAKTRDLGALGLYYFNIMHDILVTSPARPFRHPPTPGFHLNRLMELTGGKGERVKEAMIGLGKLCWNQPGRSMAVVASRNGAMAGFDPAVQMVLHNVAIGAGIRIVAQIRSSLGINEGVGSDAEGQSESDRNDATEKSCQRTGCKWLAIQCVCRLPPCHSIESLSEWS